MVETMFRRSSSTQGSSACRAAIPTARPQGPAPITTIAVCSGVTRITSLATCRSLYSLRATHHALLHLDDLIPPRPHADVAYRHARQGLQTIEIAAGMLRQIVQPAGLAGGLLPAG